MGTGSSDEVERSEASAGVVVESWVASVTLEYSESIADTIRPGGSDEYGRSSSGVGDDTSFAVKCNTEFDFVPDGSSVGEGVMVGSDEGVMVEDGMSTVVDVAAMNTLDGRSSNPLKPDDTVMLDGIRWDSEEVLTGVGETRGTKLGIPLSAWLEEVVMK